MQVPVLDLLIPVSGSTLPWDHSYALFGALCRRQPLFHQPDHPIGVFPINGTAAGNRTLTLTERSALRLRLPDDKVGEALPLLGVTLELDGHKIRLGNPEIRPVVPAAKLFAPWVTYGGKLTGEDFLQHAQAEMRAREIGGIVSLVAPLGNRSKDGGKGQNSLAVRRTRRIKGASVVGYAVQVNHLDARSATALCQHGLGGRRHFGGGLFLPARG